MFEDLMGEVIYIGRTNNLDRRLSQHFGENGHLGKEVYYQVHNIHVAETDNPNTTSIYEMYYIGKYKPKYNTQYKSGGEFTQELAPLDFILYRTVEQPYDNLQVKINVEDHNINQFDVATRLVGNQEITDNLRDSILKLIEEANEQYEHRVRENHKIEEKAYKGEIDTKDVPTLVYQEEYRTVEKLYYVTQRIKALVSD